MRKYPRIRRFIFQVPKANERIDYIRATSGERKIVWYRAEKAIETRLVATDDKQSDRGSNQRLATARWLREQRENKEATLKAIWCC